MSIPNLSTPPPWPVRYIPALEDKSADADGNPLTGVGGYVHNGSPSSILAQSPAILKTVRVSGTGTAADADYTADPDATFSEFNGVDDYLIPDPLGLTGNDPRSVFVRYSPSAASNDDTLYYQGEGGAGEKFTLRLDNLKVRVEVSGGGYTSALTQTAGVPEWVGVTFSGSTLADCELWLGETSENAAGTTAVITLDTYRAIGVNDLFATRSRYADGRVFEVLVYDRVLTSDEITSLDDTIPEGALLHITPSQSSNGMEDQNGTLYPNQGTGNLKANNRWTNGANYVQSGPSATIDIGTESWTNATDSALPPLSGYSVGSLGSPAPTVDYLGSPFTELYTRFDGVDDFIDTGVVPEYDGAWAWETRCRFIDPNTPMWQGSQSSAESFYWGTNGGGYWGFRYRGGSVNSLVPVDSEWHTFKTTGDGLFFVDGVLAVDLSASTGATTGQTLWLGKGVSDVFSAHCEVAWSKFTTGPVISPNSDGSGTMIDQNGTVYANEAGTPLGTGGELRRMDYTYLHSVPKIGQGGALLQWAKDGDVDLCHMKQLAAYDNAKQYTAAEYSKNLKFVNAETEDCGTAGLVPYPIDSGDGIGPSGEWYPVDEDKVYLVEE